MITYRSVILFIWLTGSITTLAKLICNLHYTKNIVYLSGLDKGKQSEHETEILKTFAMKNGIDIDFKIFKCSIFNKPFIICSKRPIICLPTYDLTDEELKYIFLHEMNHYIYKDSILKSAVELLVIFYWWNPMVYILRKQTTVLLEIRNDHRISKNLTYQECLTYLDCLIKISKYKLNYNHWAIEFSRSNPSLLKKRFNTLINNPQSNSLNPLSLFFISSFWGILLLTYIFVLAPNVKL